MNVAQIKDEIRKLNWTDKAEIYRWINEEVSAVLRDEQAACPPTIQYRLVVGIVGIIFNGDFEAEAREQFKMFVEQSKAAGSAGSAGERTSVTLFKNQEIISEYHPPDV